VLSGGLCLVLVSLSGAASEETPGLRSRFGVCSSRKCSAEGGFAAESSLAVRGLGYKAPQPRWHIAELAKNAPSTRFRKSAMRKTVYLYTTS